MRNLFSLLLLVAVMVLGTIFLLPVLGFLLVLVVGFLLLGLGLLWVAPFLVKLPWFRDRIHVDRSRGQWFVHFGGPGNRGQGARGEYRADDVIDVEGREVAVDESPATDDGPVIGEITDGRRPDRED